MKPMLSSTHIEESNQSKMLSRSANGSNNNFLEYNMGNHFSKCENEKKIYMY